MNRDSNTMPAQGPTKRDRFSGFLRLLATFGGAVAMLIAGAMTFIAIERASDDREWVGHTQEVIEQVTAALVAIQGAETGQRGYLITGDTAYLEPYNAAIPEIRRDTAALRVLTDDNPSQQHRLDLLGPLLEAKMSELERTIAVRRTNGRASAELLVRTDRGKAMMDSIRLVLDALVADEHQLLAQRQAEAQRSARTALVVLIVGTFAAIISALFLNGMLSRYADEQKQTAAVLSEQNDQLSEQATELEAQSEQLQEQATELEMANENLSEQVTLIEAANTAKSDFLAAVSHELRTPLNAIDGYTELLLLGLRGELNAEQQADVARIKKSSRHLLTLINQVLNMAKVESGQIDLECGVIPVPALLQDAEVLIQPQMAAKSIAFSIQPCDPATVIYADPDRTKQILLNLMSNAQKFTDSGGSVVLGCEGDDGGMLRIIVKDTGRGIPATKLGEIFEPFTQLDRLQTPDKQRGIGLGLSISRTLAHAMGGDLTVASEVGAGSVFTLTLPTSPPDVRPG